MSRLGTRESILGSLELGTSSLYESNLTSQLGTTDSFLGNLVLGLVSTPIIKISISHTLDIVQDISSPRIIEKSISHTLTIVPDLDYLRIIRPNISHSLTITQDISRDRFLNQGLSQSLNIEQTLNRQMIYVRNINQVVPIVQGRRQKLGEIWINIPGLVVSKINRSVVLETQDDYLKLPRPLLGNSEEGYDELIIKRSINGTKYVYVKTNDDRSLKYTFGVTKPKAEEARTFIKNNLSKPVTMTNWQGEIWYGYIMNNPFDFKITERWGPYTERHEFDLEFQGIKLN